MSVLASAESAIGGASVPRRLRVLFVNRSYWPDVEATGQFLTELCEDLADEFDVHVLCGQPRQTVDDVRWERAGRSLHHGVVIHRVRHAQFDKASFWGRLANMVTFQTAAAWWSLRVPRPDVVVVETDPPFLCLLGSLLQRLRGVRLICYLHDIYPDVAVALGQLRERTSTGVLRRLFHSAYCRSDAVIVLSRDMRAALVEAGVPGEKIEIIPNWVDVDAVHPVKESNRFRRRHDLEGKFVAMYSGNMGLSQRLDQVLAAAELLRDRDDVVLAMVGDGADRGRLDRIAAERCLANVRFFPYQPKEQLADSLSAADLHLVILRPEVKRLLMPSKLYGALASGTPVLVAADPACELSSIVADNNLGCVVPSDDPGRLAAAICDYADSPALGVAQGERARRYAVDNCRRETSVAAMREVLLGRSSPAPTPLNSAAAVPELAWNG